MAYQPSVVHGQGIFLKAVIIGHVENSIHL